MNKLPKIRYAETPAWQKERLTNWLRERRLNQALSSGRADKPACNTIRFPPDKRLVRPYDAKPKVGEIRLLAPGLLPDGSRPLYVAIIGAWDNDQVVAAPFGPYSEPATTGELQIGRATLNLRVLCLWNARSYDPAELAQSWIADVLSRQEQDDARAVFRHVATGAALPAALARRIGPPVVHAHDPRIEYQQEQKQLLDQVGQWNAGVVQLGQWFTAAMEQRLAKAAADRPAPRGESWYKIPALKSRLEVFLTADWNSCACMAFDDQGNPTNALDGAVILGAGNVKSKPFKQGQATIKADGICHGFRLKAKDGSILELRPMKRKK